jgi:fructose-specific phosphotransferase system IIA component
MVMKELINLSLINLILKAKTKQDAIEELATLLLDQDIVDDFKGFLDDIYAREAIFSTGIGYGIAIPHAKSKHVKKPSVAFARSDEGVWFDAMDSKNANLFFMIAMPEDGTNAHLKVLAMLSRKLMHESFREALLEAKTNEEALALLETMS